MTPQRIQLRRTKGWRKPEGAVVVSRPSKWGNPYRVGTYKQWEQAGVGDWSVVPSHYFGGTTNSRAAADAVRRFRHWIHGTGTHFYMGCSPRGPITPAKVWLIGYGMAGQPGVYATFKAPYGAEEIRAELAGHDLACWCPLDQPCHADVLLEIANPPADSGEGER